MPTFSSTSGYISSGTTLGALSSGTVISSGSSSVPSKLYLVFTDCKQRVVASYCPNNQPTSVDAEQIVAADDSTQAYINWLNEIMLKQAKDLKKVVSDAFNEYGSDYTANYDISGDHGTNSTGFRIVFTDQKNRKVHFVTLWRITLLEKIYAVPDNEKLDLYFDLLFQERLKIGKNELDSIDELIKEYGEDYVTTWALLEKDPQKKKKD